ncbi:N2227-like protein [Zopfochytrium polystomum]|nr:N2227-like protein [Zopfochytrium polystomum]
MDKVRSTIRQFVRDWAVEGAVERAATYAPVLEAVERVYAGVGVRERGAVQILVPGAGLGRLAFEIAKAGFSSQGNEFSFFMLIASNYILNTVTEPNQITLYPWIHGSSNHVRAADQLAAVTVPDVAVRNAIPPTADFSMVAGDFLEVYGDPDQKGAWNAVVTCYFIDTAKNIFEYLRVIAHALADGGVWINLGPLLYHFEGMKNEMSVDLTLEEVKTAARSLGFVFEEESMMESTYTSNPNSMLKYRYNCAFWVARKMGGSEFTRSA